VSRAYAIIDDFLPQQEHLSLWDAFQPQLHAPESAAGWNRFYRLMDGDEPANSKSASRKLSLRDDAADISQAPSMLRAFGEKLSQLMTGERPPISVDTWNGFSLSAWVYQPGAGLEWHSDTGRIAAYIYYMHPEWRSSWGGELLIAADGARLSGAQAAEPSRCGDPKAARESVCETGGVFVYPRPNRLVILRGGIPHCVKKVEGAAGKVFRASLSGFFFDMAGANSANERQ
jgi:Rps23 Pro-64 3,4-dihydroxylase Tpa1-like proline 4-hydroxylase